MAKEQGVPMSTLPVDVLQDSLVAENSPERCYHCKKAIFQRIIEEAKKDGYTLLIDGTNASDDAGDRPGMRALRELSVRSPLRECGLTKDCLLYTSYRYSQPQRTGGFESGPCLCGPFRLLLFHDSGRYVGVF